MSIKPMFESDFYHDGRGPELQKVKWKSNGRVLAGFEYFNPDDEYISQNLRHLSLEGVEAFSMSSEEVHGNILASGNSKSAIFEVNDSKWFASFNQRHLEGCKHYQIMFYDEIYDVICRVIILGRGQLNA